MFSSRPIKTIKPPDKSPQISDTGRLSVSLWQKLCFLIQNSPDF